MSQHSVGRTRMTNLLVELGWIIKNLAFGLLSWALGFGAGFYRPYLALLTGLFQSAYRRINSDDKYTQQVIRKYFSD